MNPRLTRNELLRRGAAGRSAAGLPVAPRRLRRGRRRRRRRRRRAEGRPQLRELAVLHRRRQKPTTLEDVHDADGDQGQLLRGDQRQRRVLREGAGAALAGQRHRPRHLRLHRQLALPGPARRRRAGSQKLDKDLIPNIANLVDAQASPPFDPDREYSLPWQSGMTGIAWNEDVTGPGRPRSQQLLEDPKLKGKVTMLQEMADSVGLVMLAERRRPGDGHGRDASTRRSRPCRRRSTRGRSAASRATTTRSRWRRATSPPRSRGRATSSSSSPTTRSSSGRSRSTGGMIWTDNMLIPTGGSVPTASTYMNFVYDPAIAAQIAAYDQLRDAGQGREGGAREDRSGDARTTR